VQVFTFFVIIRLQALINEGASPDEYEFEASGAVSAKSDISLSMSLNIIYVLFNLCT